MCSRIFVELPFTWLSLLMLAGLSLDYRHISHFIYWSAWDRGVLKGTFSILFTSELKLCSSAKSYMADQVSVLYLDCCFSYGFLFFWKPSRQLLALINKITSQKQVHCISLFNYVHFKNTSHRWIDLLKGQCHEIILTRFFHQSHPSRLTGGTVWGF